MSSKKRPLFFALLFSAVLMFSANCIFIASTPSRPRSGKKVKRWVRPNGCRVKEITYYCFSPEGDTIWKIVRCPDGRYWKTKRFYSRSDCGHHVH